MAPLARTICCSVQKSKVKQKISSFYSIQGYIKISETHDVNLSTRKELDDKSGNTRV